MMNAKQLKHITDLADRKRGTKASPELVEKNRQSTLGVKKSNTKNYFKPKDPAAVEKRRRNKLAKNGGKYKDDRQSPAYFSWRDAVLEAYNYTCQHCWITEDQWKAARKAMGYKRIEGLNAHHIKSWDEYPELRFDVDNGVPLCVSCHKILEECLKHQKLLNLVKQIAHQQFPIRPVTSLV